jgi:hypothetical protein
VHAPPSQKPSRSIVFVLTKSHEPPRHVGDAQSTNLQPPPSHDGDDDPIKRHPPPRQATPLQPWYPHAPDLHGESSHVDARTFDHFKAVDAPETVDGRSESGSATAANHVMQLGIAKGGRTAEEVLQARIFGLLAHRSVDRKPLLAVK